MQPIEYKLNVHLSVKVKTRRRDCLAAFVYMYW